MGINTCLSMFVSGIGTILFFVALRDEMKLFLHKILFISAIMIPFMTYETYISNGVIQRIESDGISSLIVTIVLTVWIKVVGILDRYFFEKFLHLPVIESIDKEISAGICILGIIGLDIYLWKTLNNVNNFQCAAYMIVLFMGYFIPLSSLLDSDYSSLKDKMRNIEKKIKKRFFTWIVKHWLDIVIIIVYIMVSYTQTKTQINIYKYCGFFILGIVVGLIILLPFEIKKDKQLKEDDKSKTA